MLTIVTSAITSAALQLLGASLLVLLERTTGGDISKSSIIEPLGVDLDLEQWVDGLMRVYFLLFLLSPLFRGERPYNCAAGLDPASTAIRCTWLGA